MMKRYYISAVSLVVFFIAFHFFPIFEEKDNNLYLLNTKILLPQEIGKSEDSGIKNIAVEAKTAYIFDIKNQKSLFAKNSDMPMPLASLTKVMTVILAKENLDSRLLIKNDENILREGNSQNEIWPLDELFKITLVESSNQAALAIAKSISAEKGGNYLAVTQMNGMAQKLNMRNTFFKNETGLDTDQFIAGGYGSLEDIQKLFTYGILKYPEIFEPTTKERSIAKSSAKEFVIENTNEGVNEIPGLVASKTGFTDLAGGNLAIIIDIGINHPIFIGVMGSSKEGRFTDVKKMTEATLEYFQKKNSPN